MEQVKLERLLMEEVSGVDDPANQLPGWMVAKSATVEKDSGSGTMAKIKGILSLGVPQQEGLDMDRAELEAILDERDESLVAKVAEAVAVAKSAPAEGEGATEATATEEPVAPAAEEVPVLSAEDVKKMVDEGIEGLRGDMTAIFEALIDRAEGVEKALGIAAKKSLDGQEADAEGTEPVEKSAPDLGDAIAAALKR